MQSDNARSKRELKLVVGLCDDKMQSLSSDSLNRAAHQAADR